MLGMELGTLEKVVNYLEEHGYLFEGYMLHKVNNQNHILGTGRFSVVYEMVLKEDDGKKYALKVIYCKLNGETISSVRESVMLQRKLGKETEYIVEIVDAQEIYAVFDKVGKVKSIYKNPCNMQEGIFLQFVLMEKLECVVKKDKFNKVLPYKKGIREEDVLAFVKQIGQALQVLHNHQAVHRDIKLENIFWDEINKIYKLGDFGFAKQTEGEKAETVIYTDGYGAPEIRSRSAEYYDYRADIYSFGVCIYLLLNGLCFPGSEGYLVNQIQYAEGFIFPAPKDASVKLTRLVRKMCCFYKEERYESVEEVFAGLENTSDVTRVAEEKRFGILEDFTTETFQGQIKKESRHSERIQRKCLIKEKEDYDKNASLWYFTAFLLLSCLLMGNNPWSAFIKDKNLGWTIITAMLLGMDNFVMMKAGVEKLGKEKFYSWCGFFEKLPILLIIIGFILLIMQKTKMTNIMGFVNELNFIKIGMVILIRNVLLNYFAEHCYRDE